MTILAQDTAIRANRTGGGTASDGVNVWGSAITGTATLNIASNELVMTGGGGGADTHYQLGSVTTKPINMLIRTASDDLGKMNGVLWRYTSASGGNGYRAGFDDVDFGGGVGGFGIDNITNGSRTNIGSFQFGTGRVAGDYWWIRLIHDASNSLMIRVWKDGTSEPGTWNYTATNTSHNNAGGFGLTYYSNTGASNCYYDHLTVTDNVSSSTADKVIKARFFQYGIASKIWKSRFYQYAKADKVYKTRFGSGQSAIKKWLTRFNQYAIVQKIYKTRFGSVLRSARSHVTRFYQYQIIGKALKSRFPQYDTARKFVMSRFKSMQRVAKATASRLYLYQIQQRIYKMRLYLYQVRQRAHKTRLYHYQRIGRAVTARFFHFQPDIDSLLTWDDAKAQRAIILASSTGAHIANIGIALFPPALISNEHVITAEIDALLVGETWGQVHVLKTIRDVNTFLATYP